MSGQVAFQSTVDRRAGGRSPGGSQMPIMANMRWLLPAAVLLLALALHACGQKGDLYLPEEPPPSAQQDDEQEDDG